jgi:hypothetical protein
MTQDRLPGALATQTSLICFRNCKSRGHGQILARSVGLY